MGKRGPARKPGSQVKIPCAFHKCRSGRDTKNVPGALIVSRTKVNLALCRKTLRTSCSNIRFVKKHQKDNGDDVSPPL